MYKVSNGVESFDDHLDELGFSFGGALKAASPLLKVGSAIGIPGAGAASAAVDIAGKIGKKKKAKKVVTTPARPEPVVVPASTVSRPASTIQQDPVLSAKISNIASILNRNEIRNRALKIIRSKGADARYKKELIQKLNTILKQLKQLDAYVHSQLSGQTAVSPGVIDILGGKDFVSKLGR